MMLLERALSLAADTNTKTAPESENKLQDLCEVIRGTREKLRTKATSDDCHKKITSCCKLQLAKQLTLQFLHKFKLD